MVGNKYLRLKRGTLNEQTIITTLVTRNGIDFINPLATVVMDEKKFTGYLLNPEHEKGKHKALVFDKVLGFNLSNYKQLMQAIKVGIAEYPITRTEATSYGIQYGVDIPIRGTAGRAAVVITGRIEVIDGKLRFITAYVKD